MHTLLMNLIAVAIVTLTASFLIKHPKGHKLTVNARCERDYMLLMFKIAKCKERDRFPELENEVEEFYVEYAGKAVRAREYRNDLFNLINTAQYV